MDATLGLGLLEGRLAHVSHNGQSPSPQHEAMKLWPAAPGHCLIAAVTSIPALTLAVWP